VRYPSGTALFFLLIWVHILKCPIIAVVFPGQDALVKQGVWLYELDCDLTKTGEQMGNKWLEGLRRNAWLQAMPFLRKVLSSEGRSDADRLFAYMRVIWNTRSWYTRASHFFRY
jgi:hypothetical protein